MIICDCFYVRDSARLLAAMMDYHMRLELQNSDPRKPYEIERLQVYFALEAATCHYAMRAFARLIIADYIDNVVSLALALSCVFNASLAAVYLWDFVLPRLGGRVLFGLPWQYCLLGVAACMFSIGLSVQWRSGWRNMVVHQ